MTPLRGQRAAQGAAREPFLSDPDLTVWLGDAVESLRQLPDGSVQMCVTSPPFFGLRDYGTGTWIGGDAECEHLMPPVGGERTPSPTFRDTETEKRDRAQYREACPHCGARRVDQQIGLEPTLEQWVAALVGVFREVRRVMRPDGTLWLELADSYNTHRNGGTSGGSSTLTNPDRQAHLAADVAPIGARSRLTVGDVKPKDLFGAPFEVVFALRADGWWWRQTIIWHKRNAMPESASDRPTTAHSYLFLLSPSARYYYDDDAIAEPAEWARWGSQDAGKYETVGKGSLVQPLTKEQIDRRFAGGRQRGSGAGGYKTTDERNERFQGTEFQAVEDPEQERLGWHDHSADLEQGNGKQTAADGTPAGTVRSEGWREEVDAGGGLYRRSRSVWSLTTEPNRLAVCSVCDAFWDGDHPDEHCGQRVVEHFAAFPRELARRAISAGTSEAGACAECGAPWRRIVEREGVPHSHGGHQGRKGKSSASGNTDMSENARVNYVTTTTGWQPTCSCDSDERVACTVLDPFGGSGTTAMAARELGRKAVLVELRREYAVMIRERTRQQSLLG